MRIGAVAYDAKVVPIWEAIREYYRGSPVEMDVVWFSNYEAQVDALLDGWIDVAWNTNLAYVRVHLATQGTCRVLAMRDTDVGFHTLLIGRAGELAEANDLQGRILALGSADSAQAAIMPVHYLRREGLSPGEDVGLLRFDSDVGKHGDTGRSEREALEAVLTSKADAAAVGAASWDAFVRSREVPPGRLVPFWTSPRSTTATSRCSRRSTRSGPTPGPPTCWRWIGAIPSTGASRARGPPEWVLPELEGYGDVFAAVDEQGISARW